jgi:hypothetical protein
MFISGGYWGEIGRVSVPRNGRSSGKLYRGRGAPSYINYALENKAIPHTPSSHTVPSVSVCSALLASILHHLKGLIAAALTH